LIFSWYAGHGFGVGHVSGAQMAWNDGQQPWLFITLIMPGNSSTSLSGDAETHSSFGLHSVEHSGLSVDYSSTPPAVNTARHHKTRSPQINLLQPFAANSIFTTWSVAHTGIAMSVQF